MTPRQRARRGLAIYFGVLVAGSAFFHTKIILSGKPVDEVQLLILALMFVPAAASLAARVSLREGFEDVSFRLGGGAGLRGIRLAWVFPTVVGFLAYGVAWSSGLAEFQSPLSPRSHLYVSSGLANLLRSFLVSATLGAVINAAGAFGEELGWRGYMLTRLISSGVPKPVLVSGTIWALWHVPIILSGQYAAGPSPRLSAVLFVVGAVAEGYLIAFVRLRSGSIWPAVWMHGAWNAIIQGTFDRATVGTPLVVGESGWLTVAVILVFVLTATRGVWALYRAPGKPLSLPSGKPPSLGTL